MARSVTSPRVADRALFRGSHAHVTSVCSLYGADRTSALPIARHEPYNPRGESDCTADERWQISPEMNCNQPIERNGDCGFYNRDHGQHVVVDALALLLLDPFFIAMALDHTQGGKTVHHRMPDKLEAWKRPRVIAPILSHEGEWGRWRVCGQDRQDG